MDLGGGVDVFAEEDAVLAVPAADVEDLGWGRGDSAGEGYCALGYEQDASGHSSS